MNSDITSTSPFINSTDTSDKIDNIISTLEDIISTFRAQGSSEAKQLLHKVLERNRLPAGSLLQAASVETSDSYEQTNKANR